VSEGIIRAINNRFIARKQADHDNYETPPWCVGSLLARHPELLSGRITEPCCGAGAIVREIERLHPASVVHAYEIRDEPHIYPLSFHPFDYLTEIPTVTEHAICNPPFKQSTDFVRRCLDYTTDTVAIFQRTQWLESKGRYRDIWSCLPLSHVWIFVERVGCFQEGQIVDYKQGGMLCFAWFVFKHGHVGPAQIGWINDKPDFSHDTRIRIASDPAAC
jgi:hypothetical protein